MLNSFLLFALLAIVAGVLAYFVGPTKVRDDFIALARGVFSGEVDNALRRMWPLWVVFVIAFAIVLFLSPMKAGLTLYGIGKVALGGLIGYLVDRYVFRDEDRPEVQIDGISKGTAWKRRAWIVCAAILAMALVP